MNKFVTSLIISITILSTSMYAPRANALIRVLFKSKVVKVIGGIGSAGGAILLAYGIAIIVVSLIILDDNQVADIEFRNINAEDTTEYVGFTKDEVETYNSEVELLNSVRQTIVSEVSDVVDTADAEALWDIYSQNLSPATYEIAKSKVKDFIENLNK